MYHRRGSEHVGGYNRCSRRRQMKRIRLQETRGEGRNSFSQPWCCYVSGYDRIYIYNIYIYVTSIDDGRRNSPARNQEQWENKIS